MNPVTDYDKCQEYFAEIVSLMKWSNQPERVLHLVVDRIVRMLKCQTCAVILIHPETESLSIKISYGISLTFCKEFHRRWHVGALGELLWTGKPIVIADSSQHPQLAEEMKLENPFSSCACVQIAVDHRTLGYLYADSKERNAFSEKDVRLLQIYADLAGIAFHKAQLHDENLKVDPIDHESGLWKYSHFTEHLREHLERAERFREHFALLIIDIDNFRGIVNTYGYNISRQFLKEMGDHIKHNLHAVDAASRYGADEFIILLANVQIDDAVTRAEELRRAIKEHSFTQQQVKATVSIGIGLYPQDGKNIDELMVKTKNALFEAQRSGRDRTFYYPIVHSLTGDLS